MAELEEDPFFGVLNRDFVYILNGTEDIKLPNNSYPTWCMDCDHPVCVKRQHRIIRNNWHKYPAFEYKLNNYGFRSDDFSSELAGSNMLYGGCSNTFALGVPIEYSWAYQLNKHLGKNNFFSTAVNSSSIDVVVHNTINYIRKIGKPAGIVLLLPDLLRVVSKIDMKLDKKVGTYPILANTAKQIMGDEKTFPIIRGNLLFRFYEDVTALEMICETLDIPLMWSTWNEDLNNIIKEELHDKFNHYVNMLDNIRFEHWQENEEADSSMFWKASREGHYPGVTHKVYADVMFELWQKKYGSPS